jgi:RNA-directed DNA polymerase
MNDNRKSDNPIVPKKSPNNGGPTVGRTTEAGEGRGLAKGNSKQQNRVRAQNRKALQHALQRVRQAAKKDKNRPLTTLWHHVYNVDRLREAYFGLKRNAAPGVDGMTWRAYGEALEDNLQDLAGRLKHGAYRAQPVRRTYIPKPDGRQRPLGVTTLEDKIVQRACTQVLNAVYETEFLGFSYGFRPGRSQHMALDALAVAIQGKSVNWVFDADIRGFYDAIDHEWLMKFIGHRIADQRIHRHVQKWLKAGVLEDGQKTAGEAGVPQGGSISPVLSNIYLHYALDQWAHQWRGRHARGDVIIVRYADDFVVGFQYESDARRFWADLHVRMERFGLELHPEKTHLIEFGAFAVKNRQRRGEGKPETFDFLGFTHICHRTRKGRFVVLRQTMKKRMRAKLRAIKERLRVHLHAPVPWVGRQLCRIWQGHLQYYGVPRNGPSLCSFRLSLVRLWYRSLRRRSQKSLMTWERMIRLQSRYLSNARIVHPYPIQRLRVMTRGRSPVH